MTNCREVRSSERSSQLGIISDLPREFPVSGSLEIFRKTYYNRQFEMELARVYDTGIIKMPIYLSL